MFGIQAPALVWSRYRFTLAFIHHQVFFGDPWLVMLRTHWVNYTVTVTNTVYSSHCWICDSFFFFFDLVIQKQDG